MPTINETIVLGTDDVFSQQGNNSYQFLSTVYIGAGHQDFGTAQYINWTGVRFQTINIPSGSTIDSATLTFVMKDKIGTPSVRIYGNDVDDAATWGATNKVRNITKTAAFTALDVTLHDSTNDVKTIVQEIVDRGGWAANNDIAFGLFDQVGTGNNNIRGVAYEYTPANTYYGSVANPAKLDITYTAGAAGGAGPIFHGRAFGKGRIFGGSVLC